nr:hypothetical protein [Tanacetum cinerariifolium]
MKEGMPILRGRKFVPGMNSSERKWKEGTTSPSRELHDKELKKLEDTQSFVVGSGALGCEFLKNLALMGVSCGTQGKLTVTDDDVIEKSNLSMQFTFRDWNIRNQIHYAATSTGASFWSAPKCFPRPLQFSVFDLTHLNFVLAGSILRTETFGIPIPDWAKNPKKLSEAIDQLESRRKILSSGYVMKPIQFKKDDDTNHHMDFIAGLANMRAKNYSILDVDKLRAKFIVGRIILAIATSTTMATGLVCLEIYKVIDEAAKWKTILTYLRTWNIFTHENFIEGISSPMKRLYSLDVQSRQSTSDLSQLLQSVSLHIESGVFDDDLFWSIISGSPVLETLVLGSCYGFEVLDNSNDSVKNFFICGYSSEMDTLRINAPHTKSLTIKERSFATCDEFSAASVANLPTIF